MIANIEELAYGVISENEEANFNAKDEIRARRISLRNDGHLRVYRNVFENDQFDGNSIIEKLFTCT